MNSNTQLHIIIFGGSGDLATRALFPSLFYMFEKGMLPEHFVITAFAYSEYTNKDFQKLISLKVHENLHHDSLNEDVLAVFLEKVQYHQGSFEDAHAFESLWKKGDSCNANTLLYLAAPPQYFMTIFENVAHVVSGSYGPNMSEGDTWLRIAIEKPFGNSLSSAKALDTVLHKSFRSDDIFHVDHYLDKPIVETIALFHKQPPIACLWKCNDISRVDISFSETRDVSDRGHFYDRIGAWKDVGQNHMLELVAVALREDFSETNVNAIRDERADILERISVLDDRTKSIRAQYLGYLDHDGVADGSTRETYFKVFGTFKRSNQIIPISLTSGKGLDKDEFYIDIFFGEEESQKKLRFYAKPHQSVIFTENGIDRDVTPARNSEHQFDNAYEKIFTGIMNNQKRYFKSDKEIFASWVYSDAVDDLFSKMPLGVYNQGQDVVNNK